MATYNALVSGNTSSFYNVSKIGQLSSGHKSHLFSNMSSYSSFVEVSSKRIFESGGGDLSSCLYLSLGDIDFEPRLRSRSDLLFLSSSSKL